LIPAPEMTYFPAIEGFLLCMIVHDDDDCGLGIEFDFSLSLRVVC
jgi:hypothetical protein